MNKYSFNIFPPKFTQKDNLAILIPNYFPSDFSTKMWNWWLISMNQYLLDKIRKRTLIVLNFRFKKHTKTHAFTHLYVRTKDIIWGWVCRLSKHIILIKNTEKHTYRDLRKHKIHEGEYMGIPKLNKIKPEPPLTSTPLLLVFTLNYI